ncbi:ThiF family adenylyltransferase [Archangium sp.]|uniref:ThiF family adenylyltransferase n=1 Tax=Archangium sp. TaxID=1872627 RepID=UPI002D722842|nr:ThiF family adenylyltransferase [Archangium sp.]HYO56817.1 ThiF family adenylyltransferase [Archangium sp.]
MQPLRAEVADALVVALAHPAVDDARVLSFDTASGAAVLEIDIRTELPSRWRANGSSPSGVRSVETVHFEFSPAFPSKPPRIVLRPDFNRSLPHINPHQEGDAVPPCVYWGELGELMHRSGFGAIVTQVADWLEKAAFDKLINKKQGWEPVRRDSVDDTVVFNRDELEGLVQKTEGRVFLQLSYLSYPASGAQAEQCHVFAFIDGQPIALSRKVIKQHLGAEIKDGIEKGLSVAVFVWPGKSPAGRPVVCDKYLPETVSNYGELIRRADAYGCGVRLGEAIKWLQNCVSGLKSQGSFPVVVVLCARRPLPLIGSDSDLELIPYRLDASAPVLLPSGDGTRVHPVAHRDPVGLNLLRRMSDIPSELKSPVYTVLGCGSVGSKIALHLARAGIGPSHLVDKRSLSPHNLARHALPPPEGPVVDVAVPSKSKAVAALVTKLGQRAVGYDLDILEVVPQTAPFRNIFAVDQTCIINATASHAAREHLAALPSVRSRVVDVAILRGGLAGICAIEGPVRNPDCLDLMAEAYELMRQDSELSRLLSMQDPDVPEVVGQGCGSPTLRMSDAKVSMYAAAISERLVRAFLNGMPLAGELLIGRIGGDGISLTWRSEVVPGVQVVTAENDRTWVIRIADRAHRKIIADVAAYPRIETGGVVVGRVSSTRRVIFVTDVLPAPNNSRRSAGMFVLGTEGVEAARSEYERSSAGTLWLLGTWHSHLFEQGGSSMDYATARQIASSGQSPALLLIRRPSGYSAIVATGR